MTTLFFISICIYLFVELQNITKVFGLIVYFLFLFFCFFLVKKNIFASRNLEITSHFAKCEAIIQTLRYACSNFVTYIRDFFCLHRFVANVPRENYETKNSHLFYRSFGAVNFTLVLWLTNERCVETDRLFTVVAIW